MWGDKEWSVSLCNSPLSMATNKLCILLAHKLSSCTLMLWKLTIYTTWITSISSDKLDFWMKLREKQILVATPQLSSSLTLPYSATLPAEDATTRLFARSSKSPVCRRTLTLSWGEASRSVTQNMTQTVCLKSNVKSCSKCESSFTSNFCFSWCTSSFASGSHIIFPPAPKRCLLKPTGKVRHGISHWKLPPRPTACNQLNWLDGCCSPQLLQFTLRNKLLFASFCTTQALSLCRHAVACLHPLHYHTHA